LYGTITLSLERDSKAPATPLSSELQKVKVLKKCPIA
jgi:hypothetical protein